MRRYFEKIDQGLYSFDMNQFIRVQDEIMKKYKLSDAFEFEVLDKYISQISEELQEVLTAEDTSEIIEEIVDTLMYVGSTASYMLNSDFTDINRYTIIADSLNIDLDYLIKDLFIKINIIRRLFPERKWHKSHVDPRSDIYRIIDSDRGQIVLDILDSIIKQIVTFLITNFEENEVSKIMINKQTYIKTLNS